MPQAHGAVEHGIIPAFRSPGIVGQIANSSQGAGAYYSFLCGIEAVLACLPGSVQM